MQIYNSFSSNINVLYFKAYNIIYLITCNICQVEYIGQTCNQLHMRINQHNQINKEKKKKKQLKRTIKTIN